ncbi:hypothetical protein ACIG5E_32275 [Kitasatospora sp. NPDC053057]|uniref:hypothetical protein n=1 Tax=Kitasatospora sp. NPDC053057 TaxID=3364062 RepID=UPI0037C6710E
MAETLPRPRKQLALALGVVELLLAAPMLVPLGLGAFMVGVMAFASGRAAALLFPLLVVAGPLLGLGATLLIARVQRLSRDVAFPLVGFGLLAGTAIEYFSLSWS